MQQTNPPPTSTEIWNWKANVSDGYDRLIEKARGVVARKAEADILLVDDWNTDADNMGNLVEPFTVSYAGYEWGMFPVEYMTNTKINSYYSEPSQQDAKSFLDACVMIAYNGYQGMQVPQGSGKYKNFVYVVPSTEPGSDGKPVWYMLDNFQQYVSRVCNTTIPVR